MSNVKGFFIFLAGMATGYGVAHMLQKKKCDKCASELESIFEEAREYNKKVTKRYSDFLEEDPEEEEEPEVMRTYSSGQVINAESIPYNKYYSGEKKEPLIPEDKGEEEEESETEKTEEKIPEEHGYFAVDNAEEVISIDTSGKSFSDECVTHSYHRIEPSEYFGDDTKRYAYTLYSNGVLMSDEDEGEKIVGDAADLNWLIYAAKETSVPEDIMVYIKDDVKDTYYEVYLETEPYEEE